MVNLWAWTDEAGIGHVGMSHGPTGEALDLAYADARIDSIDALWRLFGGPNLVHTLEAWWQRVSQRVPIPESRLGVPVALTECWAAGVTYAMSRDARVEETQGAEALYRKVYDAQRPELFFKAPGTRVVGPGAEVGLRRDSPWQVPEPELTLVLDPEGQLFGFTIGNDMSSRDIEGENLLYLPQAKIFHHSAAIGPSLVLAETLDPRNLEIRMVIERQDRVLFDGRITTAQMRRTPEELTRYLCMEWPIEGWTALMTGTALVPPADISLDEGDRIAITITGIGTLMNRARRIGPTWAKVPASE